MADKVDRLLQGNYHLDPCYVPALLKVSTELWNGPNQQLDEILESTLSDSNISQEDLKKYIEDHKPELVAEAKRMGV